MNELKISPIAPVIIEIYGHIYYIPDKYYNHLITDIEHIKLYKYILAFLLEIDKGIDKGIDKEIDKICNSANKIFTYIITGRISAKDNYSDNDCAKDNYCDIYTYFTDDEKLIINKLPSSCTPTMNMSFIEHLPV